MLFRLRAASFLSPSSECKAIDLIKNNTSLKQNPLQAVSDFGVMPLFSDILGVELENRVPDDRGTPFVLP